MTNDHEARSPSELGARLIVELRRANDAGDDQLIVNTGVENAGPGGEAAAIYGAVQELVVVLLDQVLMILGAGEDGGSDLGAAGAAGEGRVPGGASARIDGAVEHILVELIEPAIVGAGVAAAIE